MIEEKEEIIEEKTIPVDQKVTFQDTEAEPDPANDLVFQKDPATLTLNEKEQWKKATMAQLFKELPQILSVMNMSRTQQKFAETFDGKATQFRGNFNRVDHLVEEHKIQYPDQKPKNFTINKIIYQDELNHNYKKNM